MKSALEQCRDALDHIVRRLQMDIDDGGRPDQWSMEALVKKASPALAAADVELAARPEPVARMLVWHGPSHYPMPPAAARTYAEFPNYDAGPINKEAFWHNGAPLYAAPVAAPVAPQEK